MLPTLAQEPNAGLVAYLTTHKANPHPAVETPDAIPQVYLNAGSHPDIVERVWDGLGADLPLECRLLVHGTPALVHFSSGVVLAAAIGTAYVLRLSPERVEEALRLGAKITMTWSGGRQFEVRSDIGNDWILGSFKREEVGWCRELYDALSV